MNYDNMSDFEINKAVASIVFDKGSWVTVNSCTDGTFVAKLINYKQEKFDPCNNPADMWPIIVENRMCMNWYEDDEGVYSSFSVATDDEENKAYMYDHANPLRAAAIVFLKMQNAS